MAKRPKTPPPKPPARLVEGDQALASHYGVTTKTVYNWRKAGLPHTGRVGAYVYDLDKTDPFVEQLRTFSGDDESPDGINAALKKERLKQLQIRTAGMTADLEARHGELLPRRGCELFATTLLTTLGDWCEQLPELLAGECCPKCKTRIEKRLRGELDNRRNDIADELTSGPNQHE